MDVSTLDSQSSAWGIPRRSLDVNEDIVLGIPNFSTIERFLLVGGENADDIYDRMMRRASPKGAKAILNIMDELKNKSSQNLLVTCTITGLMGFMVCMIISSKINTKEQVILFSG